MNDFERRRNEEKERLLRIYSDFSGPRLEALRGLVEDAANQYALLQDLRAELAKTGPVESYQNGANQSGRKPSAALSAYLQAAKTYAGTMTKLAAQLPQVTKRREADALDAFLAGADPGNSPSKAARLMAEIEAAADAAEAVGDAEREISQQIARTRAARPDIAAATPQELQEQIQGSQR